MKPVYRIVGFLALVAGYVLFLIHEFGSDLYALFRPLVLFLGGAIIAFFVEAEQYGIMQPVYTRIVSIVVGVFLMGASLFLALMFRGT